MFGLECVPHQPQHGTISCSNLRFAERTGRGSEELSRAKLSLEGLRHSSVKSDLQQHCVQFSFSLGRGGIRCLAAGNAVPALAKECLACNAKLKSNVG